MLPEYLAYLKKSFAAVKGDSLHVVIDCGNGAAGLWLSMRWRNWVAASRDFTAR